MLTAVVSNPWTWDLLLEPAVAEVFQQSLATWLPRQRWFASKCHIIRAARLQECFALSDTAAVAIVAVELGGGSESYLLLLGQGAACGTPLIEVDAAGQKIVLSEGAENPDVASALIEMLAQGKTIARGSATLRATLLEAGALAAGPYSIRAQSAEQSNSALFVGDEAFLKFYRKLAIGENPDVEILQALRNTSFTHTPRLLARLDYLTPHGSATLAMAQTLVPQAVGAWEHTLAELRQWLAADRPLETLASSASIQSAALLGRRTAELHQALAQALGAQEWTQDELAQIQAAVLAEVRDSQQLLQRRSDELPRAIQPLAAAVTSAALDSRLLPPLNVAEAGPKIRVHGDYHLGQVLWSAGDFVILDFEGEPARELAQRRQYASPMKDVAGMLRSYDYARQVVLRETEADPERVELARQWCERVQAKFLAGYEEQSRLSPALLTTLLVEKTAYELRYELNNRPDWVAIPLSALAPLLGVGN